MRNVHILRGGAGLAAVAIAITATGCASSGTSANGAPGKPASSSSPMHSMTPSTAGVTTTAAANLYAGLDQLLVEHVDLTANVVQNAVAYGPTSVATKNAETALGQNTDALGTAVGSVYGAAAKAQFLKLWRAHIGYFVSYTLGIATKDKAKIATAQKNLQGYTTKFATFMAGPTKLPVPALKADLKGHVTTLEAAIDAIVAKAPDAGKKLEMAAMHMQGTAAVLAGGIASSKNLPGKVTGAGSTLRGALTSLLVQHVAATSFVVQTAVANKGNLNAPEVKGAISALQDNTNQLGTAIGSTYGPAAQQKFLKLWNAHIGYFVNYTLGIATKDNAKVTTAQKNLQGYITQFATFMAGATKLPAPALAADLKGHVTTLETAIKAIVANSPSASSAIMMAENHMAGTAAVLAHGIAASKPSKFTT
jgi:hypothetical protein